MYDLSLNAWKVINSEKVTMDHRGLVEYDEKFLVIGRMGPNQTVLTTISHYTINQE